MAINTYETVFIAEPEISNEQADQLVNKIKQVITNSSGTVTGEDRWGRRRLAYQIHGHREGFYTVLNYTAEPTVVSGLEHLFNVTDAIIRHMTTRVIKKNKTFRPRRERPAGAESSGRPGGRPGYRPSGPRPAPVVTPPPAPAAEATPAAPATPATPAASTSEGGPVA